MDRQARRVLRVAAVAIVGTTIAISLCLTLAHKRSLRPVGQMWLAWPILVAYVMQMVWGRRLVRRAQPYPDRFVEQAADAAPAFVAPSASVATAMASTFMLFVIPAFMIGALIRGYNHDGPRVSAGATEVIVPWLVTLTVIAGSVGCGWRLFTRSGRVVLSPGALRITGRFTLGRTIPWDELLPGNPQPPARQPGSQSAMTLTLFGKPPPVRGADPRELSFQTEDTAVDATYLADAIRYYIEHPEYRSDIGRPGEQDRLRAALAELRAAERSGAGHERARP